MPPYDDKYIIRPQLTTYSVTSESITDVKFCYNKNIVLNNGCYYENNHEKKRGERASKSAKKLKLFLFAGNWIFRKF